MVPPQQAALPGHQVETAPQEYLVVLRADQANQVELASTERTVWPHRKSHSLQIRSAEASLWTQAVNPAELAGAAGAEGAEGAEHAEALPNRDPLIAEVGQVVGEAEARAATEVKAGKEAMAAMPAM